MFAADGAFMQDMSDFYDDDKWQLYDQFTDEINVTGSPESCLAAASPDVDPTYSNYCVQ